MQFPTSYACSIRIVSYQPGTTSGAGLSVHLVVHRCDTSVSAMSASDHVGDGLCEVGHLALYFHHKSPF